MRIENITVSNFGSYAEASVDLREVSAAVICGQNGAGKSTLFVDAPLWALFGTCRTDTDAMMKLGAMVMSVSVQFALNGQTYRITRTRSKQTKAGKSELSLQVLNGEEWVSNSGSKLTDTQQKIHDLLNADYALFVSTGFLLQGQADRFSRATASERKAILAQILRLDQYSLLKQAAGRKANECQVRMVEKDERLARLKDFLADLEQGQVDLFEAKSKQNVCESKIRILDTTIDAVKTDIATLQAKRDSLTSVQDQQTILQGKLTGYQARHRQATEQKTRLEKILSNRQAIESKVVELAELEKEEAALNNATDAATEDAQLIGKRIQAIHEEVQAYTTQKAQAQSRIDTLSSQLKEKVTAYQQETNRLEESLKRDVQASDLLGKVPCSSDLQAKCQFTLRAVEAHGRINPAEVSLAKRQTVTAEIQLVIGGDLLQEIDHLRGELDAMQGNQPGSQLDELKAKQAEIGTKLKALQDDRQRVFTAIQTAKKFTALLPELLASEQVLAKTNEELSVLAAEIASVESEIQAIRLQLLESVTLEADLMSAMGQADTLQKDRQNLQNSLQALGEEIGRTLAKIDQMKAAEVEMASLSAERDAIHKEMRLYAVLAESYQKIPVLIMENAIPMLEHEANAVLSRVSSSGMTIRLDTQKTLKSRDGLAETLDIVVRDVFGERPYEAYSGGERFRLDLSLRIGLSKLLAHRAGARLETLVIDEGLGSLDDDGLNQLRECLGALQQEFKLVLVVTHVDAMKHTFPHQIVVTKDSTGSSVTVEG